LGGKVRVDYDMKTPVKLSRARTKIIATIGPACRTAEKMAELALAGADLFRLNMAHADRAVQAETLAMIRQTSREIGVPIAVLVDLAGPKIRLGELPDGALECDLDAEFRFVRGHESRAPDELVTTYEPLIDELRPGDLVMLADGTVGMRVVEKTANEARVRVFQPGLVRSRQGLNLPGASLSAPSMDEEDRDNAVWAAENDIDFVGLSFVRSPSDVRQLKDLLRLRGSAARVVAKIEKQEALDQLDAIIDEADALMVARGDLGVEIDVARMPVVQKQIVAACRERQKPVIIATQMLDSMQHSRRPTRAEVTDVANAILDGGDACMLSGETAIGKYPREAVEMMNQVALATEELLRDNVPQPPGAFHAEGLHPLTAAIVYGAGHIAAEIEARLIVVASHTGAIALALSKQRNYVPTIGVSDSPRTLRRMCLYWGVVPLFDIPPEANEATADAVISWGLKGGVLAPKDYVVFIGGSGVEAGSHNHVLVRRVE
jgi:pyruvate kinase